MDSENAAVDQQKMRINYGRDSKIFDYVIVSCGFFTGNSCTKNE